MSQEGQNIIFGIASTTAFLTANALDAHFKGIAAMREARETSRYTELAKDAEELGNLALRLSQELAAERAKNESLKRALQQRQAFIDRMRNKAI